MDIYKVTAYKACATSALREASNGQEVIDQAEKESGVKIHIITGQEEASLIYETHIADNLSDHRSYLYVDVGGGSTELTLYSQHQTIFKESFNIGTLRLLNNKVKEEQWEQLKLYLKTNLRTYAPVEAIGTGGNINKIFSLSKRKDGKPLTLDLLKDYHKELSSSTVEERRHLYGFREDRADVIVFALQIYISIMRWSNADEIYVPKIGLADGIIRLLYRDLTASVVAG
jgi:exopolyphosphatase/guanosine-5'-triphosphate,3'-diphosphate pyrophosphatase